MTIFLGVFNLDDAKRIKNKLEERKILTEFRTHPQTCTRGCKVTVEVWGHEQDKEALISFFREERLKDLEGHDVNLELLDHVFDPNAKEAICQACGAKFPTSATECPECGLVYSINA